jgi:hypothetical protein
MKQLLTMTAMSALALAFVAMTTPASAGEYCRTDSSNMRSCGFDTLEQCQATSAGRGGPCERDPFLANPSNALAYAPKPLHAKAAGHAGKKPVENQ